MTSDLYELIDHAQGWRMPIRVRWLNVANAEVTLAGVPLLKIQAQAIIDKLDSAATHCKAHTTWYIPKLTLEAIAVKAPEGTDPETLVRWKQLEPDLAADADFVHAYCNQRGAPIKNAETMAILFGSITDFMLQWLVTHGRSINFGWGRLDAFPVRANWKNAIIGRIFKRGRAFNTYGPLYTQQSYDFFRRAIEKNMESITAYDKKTGTMRWSAEFTPGKSFHQAAEAVEKKRRDHHRWKNNYLGAVLKYLRDNIDRLHENIIAYSKETDFPYAIFPDGSGYRNPPKGWQPTRFGTAWYQVPLVTGAAIQGVEGSALVSEDEARLHEVRPVQSGAQDVRNAGAEVAGAGGNEVDSTRLPVLGSSEGQHG